jgi:hypothetical protein
LQSRAGGSVFLEKAFVGRTNEKDKLIDKYAANFTKGKAVYFNATDPNGPFVHPLPSVFITIPESEYTHRAIST